MRKSTKNTVSILAAAALAGCMACAVPAVSMADNASATQSTYTALAKQASTLPDTIIQNKTYKLSNVKIGKKIVKASKCSWKTSNKKVAAVKKGVITTKKAGKATITATYKGNSATYKLNVKSAVAAQLEDLKAAMLNGEKIGDSFVIKGKDAAGEGVSATNLYYTPGLDVFTFANTIADDACTCYFDLSGTENKSSKVRIEDEDYTYWAIIETADYTNKTELKWVSFKNGSLDQESVSAEKSDALNKEAWKHFLEIDDFMTYPTNNINTSLADLGFAAYKVQADNAASDIAQFVKDNVNKGEDGAYTFAQSDGNVMYTIRYGISDGAWKFRISYTDKENNTVALVFDQNRVDALEVTTADGKTSVGGIWPGRYDADNSYAEWQLHKADGDSAPITDAKTVKTLNELTWSGMANLNNYLIKVAGPQASLTAFGFTAFN